MANDLRMSDAAVNAEANALAALMGSGYIRIYDGTRPTTADTAVSTQVLLAELRFGSTAFGSASSGAITANAITQDSSANASGTPTWFRALKSDGTSAMWDGTVGTSSADLILNSATISAGAAVSISALTHTIPKA